MKKWQKILIRVIAMVFLIGILALLVVFSDRSGVQPTLPPTPSIMAKEDTPTPTRRPTFTPVPTNTATPTPTARPTASPTPTEPIYPYTDIENIEYINYATGMTRVFTESGKLSFGDFGYYTFTDEHGTEHTYRMADYVSIPGESDIAGGNWFFAGMLYTPNYVFAQYDFWGNARYTVFIRVTRTGRNGRMLAYMPYDEFENYRCFTASNEFIFYVRKASNGYEIVQADLNGENVSVVAEFTNGERPSGLWCKEYELVFRLKKGKTCTVAVINMNNGKLREMMQPASANDYLYVYGRYAITGVKNGKLFYSNLDTGAEMSVDLKKENGVLFGEPLMQNEMLYLQYYGWGSTKTKVLRLDLDSGQVKEDFVIYDKLTYLCGVSDKGVWTEENGGYTEVFPPGANNNP